MRNLLLLCLFVALTGCGGGSSNSAPPDGNDLGKWSGFWTFPYTSRSNSGSGVATVTYVMGAGRAYSAVLTSESTGLRTFINLPAGADYWTIQTEGHGVSTEHPSAYAFRSATYHTDASGIHLYLIASDNAGHAYTLIATKDP